MEAVVHFLLDVAGRSEDAIGVRWKDITEETNYGAVVEIRPGKAAGGKCVLTKKTLDLLNELRRNRAGKDGDLIFHWEKANSLRKSMKRQVPNDLLPDFKAHNLRKTKLTQMVKEKKLDLAYIQKYARHADIKNTMKYIEYNEDEKVNIMLEIQKQEMLPEPNSPAVS